VVASLFLNPSQFDSIDDFHSYPRSESADVAAIEESGADCVFVPTVEEMYPDGPACQLDIPDLTSRLEGALRSGHFSGVMTIVTKLLNIVSPDRLYLGEKDYQQCVILERMIEDLHFPVEVVRVKTVREPDGLAVSTRNARLTFDQRSAAGRVGEALRSVNAIVDGGERSAEAVKAHVTECLGDGKVCVRPTLVSVVNDRTLRPVSLISERCLVLVCATIGTVDVVDHIVVTP
tara:strand:+ start:23611 stop:24309 length:699 start_codon:yes stop_codon:yes gene_type:complete